MKLVASHAPLRISLFGGGTDYPEFLLRERGLVIGGTIDKFINVIVSKKEPILHKTHTVLNDWSFNETSLGGIEDKIIKKICNELNIQRPLKIISTSDLPGSSGLASSSAFTVAMILALRSIDNREKTDAVDIANEAIIVEKMLLGASVGVQDQYHASMGGFARYDFCKNGVNRLQLLAPTALDFLSQHFSLVYTGNTRESCIILEDMRVNNTKHSKDKFLIKMLEIAEEAYKIFSNIRLDRSNIRQIGELLLESWEQKKELSAGISNSHINNIVTEGLKFSYGAKLLGSGGGGFVLFCGDEHIEERCRKQFGADYVVPFNFINSGGKILHVR